MFKWSALDPLDFDSGKAGSIEHLEGLLLAPGGPEAVTEFEITGEKTLGTVAEDMSSGFRRIACLGYAEREGVVRY